MGTINKGAIAPAILLAISPGLRAQTQTLVPVSSEGIPTGIFHSVQNIFPPCPFDPFPELSLYTDGTPGNYWFDDLGYSIQDLVQASAGSGGRTMGDLPTPPGGGGDGTNSSDGGSFSYVISTNGLWMEITGITNGIVSLNLNNATNQVYEIFSAVSLSDSLTNWNIEQEV